MVKQPVGLRYGHVRLSDAPGYEHMNEGYTVDKNGSLYCWGRLITTGRPELLEVYYSLTNAHEEVII